MSHQLLFSTTNNGDVALKDLGITLPDPTINFDMLTEFPVEVIRSSSYLQDAITNGNATLVNEIGLIITDVMGELFPKTGGDLWDVAGSRESVITVTATDYYEVYRLNFTPDVDSGDYYIHWYSEITTDDTSKSFSVKTTLDDSEELGNFVDQPSENNEYLSFAGFKKVSINDKNPHFVCLEMKASASSTSVSARRTRIHIVRS